MQFIAVNLLLLIGQAQGGIKLASGPAASRRMVLDAGGDSQVLATRTVQSQAAGTAVDLYGFYVRTACHSCECVGVPRVPACGFDTRVWACTRLTWTVATVRSLSLPLSLPVGEDVQ